MATRNYTVTVVPYHGDRSVHTVIWTGLLNGDDGQALEMPGSADKSIQFQGTFGVGGSIQLEGSNENPPVNWHPLTDPQGNDIVKTAADLEAVTELTRFIRPRVTAGDGTTSLVATACIRRLK